MNNLEHYHKVWEKIDNGELSPDEIRAAHEIHSLAIDDLEVLVSKSMTVAKLKQYVYGFSDDKKADYVERYVEALLNRYAHLVDDVITVNEGSFTVFSRMTAAQYKAHKRQKALEARRTVLASLVQEHIDHHIEKIAERKKQNEARAQEMIKALEDPRTIDDWNYFISTRRKQEGLGPEVPPQDFLADDELRRMDATVFGAHEQNMRERAQENAKIEQVDTSAKLTVEKDFHTKRECDIWIVRLSERVERPEFKKLQSAARSLGARWSRYSQGFIFYNEDKANAFAGVTENEVDTTKFQLEAKQRREQRAGERLEQYAIRRDGKAVDALAMERLANTARRARMADSAEANARWEIAFAATTQSIATALVNGELWGLCGVRYGTDIVELYDVANRALNQAMIAEGIPHPQRRQIKVEDVRYAGVPYPNLTRDQLTRLWRETKGKRGIGYARKFVKKMLDGSESYVIKTRNKTEAQSILVLLDKLGLQGNDEFKWRIESYKRFERMGLTMLPVLRHAMREFIAHMVAPNQPDKVTALVRDLVGVKIPGYFPTPAPVADRLVYLVAPRNGEIGVETSSGSGNLIDAILRHDANAKIEHFERSAQLREITRLKYRDNLDVICVGDDGADAKPNRYDYAVINPPFENRQDVQHVIDTYTALRSGGRMAAIVSQSRTHDSEFADWLEGRGGYVDEFLPAGTFHESGTNVQTAIIYIEKR